ncbi:serine/threonine protein kinase [Actinomadura gamaensis]|uniref:non-specific serine/threonine protein kinase n=1 Tax=Actinomadura gamaensis TaxID=1763541 RepID=A0ABV9U0C8_9ACTN
MEPDEVIGGRFRIEAPYFAGGMARTWRAEDLRTGAPALVKVIHDRLDPHGVGCGPSSPTEADEWRHRFRREGDLLRDHGGQGIPALLGRGVHKGVDYLVMELVEGTPLQDWRKGIPVEAGAAIGMQLAETLERVHAAGIVHRDVKPQNIVLRAVDGAVFLVDFGVAFDTDPDATRYTTEDRTPGTLGYKAPELLDRGETTVKADMYGFGGVLYLLLTGRRHFTATERGAIEYEQLTRTAPRMRSVLPDLPEDLDDLVAGLLERDPSRRPGWQEVKEVLARYLPQRGAPALPGLVPDPTLRFRDAAAGPPAQTENERRTARRRGWSDAEDCHAFLRAVPDVDRMIRAQEFDRVPPHFERLLVAARRRWGFKRPEVALGQLRWADALRAGEEGRCIEAGHLYRELERGLRRRPDHDARVLWCEAQLGIAECMLVEEGSGKLAEAGGLWRSVAEEISANGIRSPWLRERLEQVRIDLAERGWDG